MGVRQALRGERVKKESSKMAFRSDRRVVRIFVIDLL